ncbi:hypothetical protein OXX80_010907 [Metschnikowia pulcherrima]
MWCYRVALLTLIFPVIVAIKVSPKAYHSNAEESGLSNFMNKNKPKAGHVEIQQAKEDISWLISDLRSYVCNNSFNYGQFLLEKDEFWKEFLDIEFLAEKECIKEEKELNVQLKFARHMLNTMVYSAEKMQRYTGINIPGQALIFKMLELNVRLLAVHNLDGTIDCWDETVRETFTRLERTWLTWREYMKAKAKVPPGMKKLFEAQSEKAKRKFDRLKLQIRSCPIRSQA